MLERIEVNLLPAEYRVHTRQSSILPSEIVYPLIVFGFVTVVLAWWTMALQSDIGEYTRKIADAQAKITQNKQIQDDINTVRQQKQTLEQKIHALELISVDREKWVRLQELFCKTLPSITWLERLEEKSDSSHSLVLEGKTLSFAEVGQFMSQLRDSRKVSAISLKSIEQMQNQDKAYKFSLECVLVPDSVVTAAATDAQQKDATQSF
ncbi:MAG: PilN domain-containing protein [Chitinivibrionales bacterium]|nr:PilN domain-containing protein [Chitinivibrionales bacterium]